MKKNVKSFEFNYSPTLTRYVVRNYLLWFLYLLFGFFVLIMIFEIKEVLRISPKYPDLDVIQIFMISLLKIPYVLDKLFPFLCFFAALFSMLKLNKSNEFIFTQTIGMSIMNFVVPYIIGVMIIQVFYVGFYNPIAATMFEKHLKLERVYYKSKFMQMSFLDDDIWMLKDGSSNTSNNSNRYFIRVKSIDEKNQSLKGVHIIKIDKMNGEYLGTIKAARAKIVDGWLKLYNVENIDSHSKSVHLNSMDIDVEIEFSNITNTVLPPEAVNIWKLVDYAKKVRSSGLSDVGYNLRWHQVLSLFIKNIALVMLAAWSVLRCFRFKGSAKYPVIGIIGSFLIYILNNVAFSMGNVLAYPVVIAVWVPAVLSLLLTWYMVLRSEEVSL